jgi:hypothetical protein
MELDKKTVIYLFEIVYEVFLLFQHKVKFVVAA